jgi:tetratricopeptide (TPR) repeat protein
VVFFGVSANDAHELESELAAANQAIENLVKEAAASESRANALSENAWRWVFRYRRIQRALRRLTGRNSTTPVVQTNGTSAVAHSAAYSEDTLTKLLALAKTEARHGRNNAAASIVQLIALHYPQNPLPQSLLSLDPSADRMPSQKANYHLALAQAHYLLGENEAAASNYRTALTFNGDLPDAHSGLAAINMPGIPYLDWLEKLYHFLKPRNVIEIGVSQSASLARVPAPAIAIGVDPVPSVIYPLQTEAHIFAETSDDFFARRNVRELLRGEPLSIGFIDGSHLFEQALRDFINLEKYCGPNSLIMFHDTVPLDELTQRREPETHFSTGDVWKTILCLKQCRPDLEIFTIATAPTGLTLVLGLDPSSDVLTKNYEHAVARFIDRGFSEVEHNLSSELNLVPNDWNVVERRLKGITEN